MPGSVGLCIWSRLLQVDGGSVFERAEAERENGEMAWRRLRCSTALRLHFAKFGCRAERFCWLPGRKPEGRHHQGKTRDNQY